MNFTVRMYWQHDLDLIALCMHPDFSMGKWIKRAVIAYARGDSDFFIPVPDPPKLPMTIYNYTAHFQLHEEKEADVIAWLRSIRSGFRNSAIRVILRFYMERVNLDPYINTKDFIAQSRRKERAGTAPSAPSVSTPPVIKKPDSRIIARAEGLDKVGLAEPPVLSKPAVLEDSSVSTLSVPSSYAASVPVPKLDTFASISETQSAFPAQTGMDAYMIGEDISSEQETEFEDSGFDLFGAIDAIMEERSR